MIVLLLAVGGVTARGQPSAAKGSVVHVSLPGARHSCTLSASKPHPTARQERLFHHHHPTDRFLLLLFLFLTSNLVKQTCMRRTSQLTALLTLTFWFLYRWSFHLFVYWCCSFGFVVIDGLDRLKKENAGARDGIRFLESEFRKGNRWGQIKTRELRFLFYFSCLSIWIPSQK